MPQTKRANAFDYSSLDSETSRFVQQQTGEIRALMKRTAQDIIEIGQKLKEVKQLLGHGRFGDWLEAEFAWTERTARRFMNVASQFGSQSHSLSDLDVAPTALYLLAAPSTPVPAREEALSRANAGESITYTAAKELKQKYTTLPTKPKAAPAVPPSPEPIPQPASPPVSPTLRHRATQPKSPSLEILAIRPSSAVQSPPAPSKETETPPPSPTPSFEVEPGFWWQLGKKHLLYCGAPNSPRFKERLPQEIALTLSFPLTPDWHLDAPTSAHSEVALFSRYRDLDETILREAIERLLLLYTEGEETVVFSFLPDPEFLLLADKLGCRCFIAEPDVRRCDEALATWNKTGDRAEKMRGLRF